MCSFTEPYPIHPNRGIAPPRFRTAEDGQLFLDCLAASKPFPAEKWIHPYAVTNGVAHINREYSEAPFELRYLVGEPDRIVTA